MQSKSKKIVSTAIISLFLSSMLFASVPLALAKRSLTLDPTSGPSGTVVNVAGTGFDPGTYRVYFDTNHNERYNWGEPYKTVTAASDFKTTLTVPSVASGIYYIIIADVWPYTSPAIDSEKFTVTVIAEIVPPAALEDIEAKLDYWLGYYDEGLGEWVPGELKSELTGWFDESIGVIDNKIDDIKTAVVTDIPATLTAIKAKTDDIVWSDITAIKDAVLSTSFGLEEIKDEISAIQTDVTAIKAKTDLLPSSWGNLVTHDWSDLTDILGTPTTGTIASEIEAIEGKLDALSFPTWGDLVTKDWSDLTDLIGTLTTGTIAGDIAAIETKLDSGGDFYNFVNDWFTTIEGKLDALPVWGDLVTKDWTDLTGYIDDAKDDILDAISGGISVTVDVLASKYENDRTVIDTTPYTIGGLPVNKVFMGTITLEIDTALGGGKTLSIEVRDGDSWAKVWTSAANAPAGTGVSISVAGRTDSSGNAIRITTTADSSKTFDYVFAYQID